MSSPPVSQNQPPSLPEDWSMAANHIAEDSRTWPPPITLVCGPKNSGKTTFSRILLQVLLNRYKKVAYLDTDVGQPEFTAPGFLSLTVVDQTLLESDFSVPCVKTPEKCFFYGDVSSKRDPAAYLKYIFTLYDYYRIRFYKSESHGKYKRGIPLVINTPGWVKGIGYDMLVDILRYVVPNYVVKINISIESKDLPSGPFWLDYHDDGISNLIEIKSALRDSFDRPVLIQKDASVLRDIRLMAYFRQCISDKKTITTIKELAHALTSHPPYEVPISSIKIKHLHCQVPITEVFYSLNCSIVGLAVSTEEFQDLPSCVGLGLVRGIDTSKGVLYVITPVPEAILEKVDLFLQGYVQLPTCLLQVQGCRSPYMSANVLPTS